MPPSFLLTQLFAEGSLAARGHSALPGAPVRLDRRRRRPGWPAVRHLRRTASPSPAIALDCSPAC